MKPIKVLLVGAASEGRELERLLWCDGHLVRRAAVASAAATVDVDEPDVVIWNDDSQPSDLLYGGLVLSGSRSPTEAVERVREHFALPVELVLSDRKVDLANGRVGAEKMSRLEVSLLRFFAANPGRIVSVDELLRKVWGYRSGVKSRAVVQTIYRLRKKIEADPRNCRHITATYGRGYKFVPAALRQPVDAGGASFIGRVSDLQALQEAVAGDARIVTLVGPPGVGKTRLVREWLTMMGARGGLFVDLTAARDGDDLRRHVAGGAELALGAADTEASFTTALAARVKQPLVLVLDNFEQLVSCSDALERWSEAAPGLTLLITSRQRLQLSTERVLSLAPLGISDGVQLLELCCQRRNPEFALTDQTRPLAKKLVEAFDALPLAIELASDWLTNLSLEDLQNRIELVYRKPRGPHRSLQTAMQSSWELLTESEQACLAQLVVFRGGFALDACE